MAEREAEFAAKMEADTTLDGLLTGGIHQFGVLGRERMNRDKTPDAFDADGYLKPCALIIEGEETPDGIVRDDDLGLMSVVQMVRINFYADVFYGDILPAMERTRLVLQGWQPANAFPITLVEVRHNERDRGALSGAALARQIYQVNSVLNATQG